MSTGQAGIVVGVADVGDAELLRHGLQLAMAVGDAGRADVIALDQEQLDGHAAVEGEPGGGGLDRHAFLMGVVQAGSRRSVPASSTTQTRQAPTALRPLR